MVTGTATIDAWMNEKTVLVSLLFLPTKLSSLFPKRQRKSIEETRRRRIPISLFAAINYFECFSLCCRNKQATRAHRGSFTSLSGTSLLYTTSTDDAMITPKEPLRKALLFLEHFLWGEFAPFYTLHQKDQNLRYTTTYYAQSKHAQNWLLLKSSIPQTRLKRYCCLIRAWYRLCGGAYHRHCSSFTLH